MRQNPHVRICGGPGSATTLVYPTLSTRHSSITRPYVRCRIASNRSPSTRQNGPFNHGLLGVTDEVIPFDRVGMGV